MLTDNINVNLFFSHFDVVLGTSVKIKPTTAKKRRVSSEVEQTFIIDAMTRSIDDHDYRAPGTIENKHQDLKQLTYGYEDKGKKEEEMRVKEKEREIQKLDLFGLVIPQRANFLSIDRSDG